MGNMERMGTMGEGSTGDLCVAVGMAAAAGATKVVAEPVPREDDAWGEDWEKSPD